MDNQKCFCHFNGYQVKDATARKAIEEIKKLIPTLENQITEQNKGEPLSFWVGTLEEYKLIEIKNPQCFYIVVDDPTYDDFVKDVESALEEMNSVIEGFESTLETQKEYLNDFETDIKNTVLKFGKTLFEGVKFITTDTSGMNNTQWDLPDLKNYSTICVYGFIEFVDDYGSNFANFSIFMGMSQSSVNQFNGSGFVFLQNSTGLSNDLCHIDIIANTYNNIANTEWVATIVKNEISAQISSVQVSKIIGIA